MEPEPVPSGAPQPRFEPGQTLFFLGEYTSPDNPGYLVVIRDVLSHFHPELRLNLISAGGPGQLVSGLRSRLLMDILSSARPDWLVLGIGLSDAMREPSARTLLAEYRRRQAEIDEQQDATFGPEYRVDRRVLGPQADVGPEPEPELQRLASFKEELALAVAELQGAGVRCVLLTTIVVGNDLANPVNRVLRSYNKAIREVAAQRQAPLVDVERAFRAVFDRAGNYRQKVALTGPQGELNAQGEALIARAFLAAFDLLPGFKHS